MNYKYIMPLFEKDEYKEALEFLVNRILSAGDSMKIFGTNEIKLMREDPDGEQELIDPSEAPKDILKPLIENLMQSTYGVNIPLMANYARVQDTFFEKFNDSILEYLDLSSLCKKVSIIDFSPFDITLKFLLSDIVSNGFISAMKYMNPNEDWTNIHLYDLSKKENVMNPLNTFKHVLLTIEGNIPQIFINEITKFGLEIISTMTWSGKEESKITIKLLPFPSYNSIINIMNAIYKYF